MRHTHTRLQRLSDWKAWARVAHSLSPSFSRFLSVSRQNAMWKAAQCNLTQAQSGRAGQKERERERAHGERARRQLNPARLAQTLALTAAAISALESNWEWEQDTERQEEIAAAGWRVCLRSLGVSSSKLLNDAAATETKAAILLALSSLHGKQMRLSSLPTELHTMAATELHTMELGSHYLPYTYISHSRLCRCVCVC